MRLEERLFLYRVGRLKNNAFIQHVSGRKQITTSFEGTSISWPKMKGVSHQSLESFALNFRFLIQDRDGTSIRKIYQLLEDREVLSMKTISFYEHWNSVRNEQVFSAESELQWTKEKLFEIVFYGSLVHHNAEYVRNFQLLRSSAAGNMILMATFGQSVRAIFDVALSASKDLRAAEKTD